MKELLRKLHNKFQRLRLRNCDFTIIANNCIAGCVYHDLGLRFDTPTVNLYIPFPDYILFLKNLRQFVYAEFAELPSDNGHPVGLLGGVIHVYFLHYQSFNEGVESWKRRTERMHWDNLYVVLSERDGCREMDLHEFDLLPYRKKIAFTHIDYPSISNFFLIHGFEKSKELGNIMDYQGMFGRKYYDQFDWVKFLNQK